MESTESSYMSSPEAPRKRSPPPPKSPTSDSMEKPTYIKFLVSNAAAGSVIGKGGSTITDFQSQSGARIQLSRNHEFFPGTTDRIIMITGTINDVIKAVDLILAKLLSELHAEGGDDVEPKTKVRLVVPNSSCGGIIGKGGSTIKSFIEESHAGIKISPQDNSYYGLNDRLVTLTGILDEQMVAIDLILSKLSEDPHYSQSMNAPFSYPGVFFSGFHGTPYTYVLPSVATAPQNAMSYGTNGAGGKIPNNKLNWDDLDLKYVTVDMFLQAFGLKDAGRAILFVEDRSNSVTIGVADGHIGFVVGRAGRNIMEIGQVTGARIKISDRGDFVTGTTNRKVTITGSHRAIRAAESMIMQKVAYASERVID